jgi:hypothetical protein
MDLVAGVNILVVISFITMLMEMVIVNYIQDLEDCLVKRKLKK